MAEGSPVADRVKETSTTTGTGDLTLAGAVLGFRTFAAVYAVGTRFYYCIELAGSAEFEVGFGRLSGASTLVRELVDQSSNANALVNFSAGAKNVFVTASANSFSEFFQSQFAAWRPPISW